MWGNAAAAVADSSRNLQASNESARAALRLIARIDCATKRSVKSSRMARAAAIGRKAGLRQKADVS